MSSSGQDYATVAYASSTGAVVWTKRYSGPGNKADEASALGVSPDGSKVFVTAFITGSASGFDYTTIVYGASAGAMLWTKSYDGPASADDGARALGVSPDGAALFVTGYSSGTTTDSDYATIAYSIT